MNLNYPESQFATNNERKTIFISKENSPYGIAGIQGKFFHPWNELVWTEKNERLESDHDKENKFSSRKNL